MDTGNQLQPGHAAVNSKVERIGETHEGVDDKGCCKINLNFQKI